ncbi:hypothetical protein HPB48_019408 [Haemaphysalis longicornis]|uniref:Uncharacterized protein n=1 Tax=Haemaphysalis longicornis TaxID=44386 RepID=A0A9J6GJX7_HAELO|nr:hypothetical protein HPB48_019408 [Haemaphysalis longicornis]
MGHRQDICPNPGVTICQTCHSRDPPIGHPCTPICHFSGLDHLTTSRKCQERPHQPRTGPANSWPSLNEITPPSLLKKPTNKIHSLMGKTERKATTHHPIKRLIHPYPATEDHPLSSLQQSLQEDPMQPASRNPPY